MNEVAWVPGPLKLDSFECLMPSLPNCDNVARSYMLSRIRNTFTRRINKINSNIDKIKAIWPESNIYELFVGLELSSDCLDDFYSTIKAQNERVRIQKDVKERLKNWPEISKYYKDFDDGDPFNEDQNVVIANRYVDSMNEKLKKKFINTYHEYWGNIPNTEFARKFGMSVEVCLATIDILKNKKLLESGVEDNLNEKEEFTGITFILHDKSFRIGIQFTPPARASNPLAEVQDPLTMEYFKRPMICPEYYVLDYSTWQRMIERHEHPYTRKHISSQRCLTELTVDNFRYYKDRIRNLGPEAISKAVYTTN